jgi:hypothetical protein
MPFGRTVLGEVRFPESARLADGSVGGTWMVTGSLARTSDFSHCGRWARNRVGERPSAAKARVLFERRPRVGLRPSPQEKHGVSEQRSTFKIQIFKANHGLSLPCRDRALGLGRRHRSVTPNHCGGACGTRWPWRAWQGQLLGGFEAGDAWGHFEDSVVGSGPETYRSMARSSRCSRLADSQPWPRIWRVVLCASEQILSPDFLPRLRGRVRKWGTKD